MRERGMCLRLDRQPLLRGELPRKPSYITWGESDVSCSAG